MVDLGDLNDTDFRAITYTGTVYGGGHLADNIWIADGSEAVTPGMHKLSDPIDFTYGTDNGDGTFYMMTGAYKGQNVTGTQIEGYYTGYEAYAWVGRVTDGSDGASSSGEITSVDGTPSMSASALTTSRRGSETNRKSSGAEPYA